jgi:hypothetical protein
VGQNVRRKIIKLIKSKVGNSCFEFPKLDVEFDCVDDDKIYVGSEKPYRTELGPNRSRFRLEKQSIVNRIDLIDTVNLNINIEANTEYQGSGINPNINIKANTEYQGSGINPNINIEANTEYQGSGINPNINIKANTEYQGPGINPNINIEANTEYQGPGINPNFEFRLPNDSLRKNKWLPHPRSIKKKNVVIFNGR